MVASPLVSVIIPTRNRCALLKQAVGSVFRQTRDCWELIVVDDASEDDTGNWLQAIDDGRLRTIRLERHSERSRTRNTGLAAARGEFVLFLDDDDLLADHALARHLAGLANWPAAIASIGGYVMFDADGHEEIVRIVRRPALRNLWQEFLFGWMATAGHSLFRRSSLMSVNGWNESYSFGEDHELWLRLSRLGPVVLVPDVLLRFRVHAGQVRPPQSRRLLTELRERVAADLEGKVRARAAKVLKARELEAVAADCFERTQSGRALYYYLRIFALAPGLFFSPLTRTRLAVPALKCLCGNAGVRAARRLLAWCRKRKYLDHAPGRF